ncbi:hypothetical protein HAX54_020715, partial [Datura stramonium]|nr:hypothetical protein [Datura stramonium]
MLGGVHGNQVRKLGGMLKGKNESSIWRDERLVLESPLQVMTGRADIRPSGMCVQLFDGGLCSTYHSWYDCETEMVQTGCERQRYELMYDDMIQVWYIRCDYGVEMYSVGSRRY